MMIKQQIYNLIKKVVKIDNFNVEIPQEKTYGDYATNVAMILAGKVKKEPMILAEEIRLELARIAARQAKTDLFEKIEVVKPGFINFFLKPTLIQDRFKEIVKDENFGKSNIGKGKEVIIDYSSPNVAKPMHVGHLRSTIIGQSLYNIYKFLGYKVVGDNHIGDWGTQFGIMITACKKYKVNLGSITIKKMLDIYVRFNKEIEKNPKLQEKAKEEFKKLEDGDKKNREIWKILKEKSLKEFEKIYRILGIKFDLVLGESFYEKDLKGIIQNALRKKIAKRNSDNSVIIPLGKDLVPCLIQKSDGATLYETRDLATIKYRVEKYKPHKILYVVGNEQSFHFEQLFRSAELLDYGSYSEFQHIKFGLILDENRKKIATRKGVFIGAKDLINKIIELAEEVVKEKNPKMSVRERKKTARIIGVGALKYNDLSQNRKTDIIFDWKKMLSFEGDSAPYIQYSYVRLKSILRKVKLLGKFDSKFLKEKEELEIIRKIDLFPVIIQEVVDGCYTNILANYLFELASLVNNFYEKHPVLKAEKDIKSARLALIKATTIVLKRGLNLLGIDTLEKM